MAWADNFVCLNVNHLEWKDDCTIIYFYHYNGYQEGVNPNEPWHIYSNALSPEIFPVLHLAKYVLEYTILLKVDCHFSPGCLQCNCFMKVFIAFLK